jgi:methionyl aminopeptidase
MTPPTVPRAGDGTYNPFPNFAYTGAVRAVYPRSPKRAVPDHIPRPDYAANGRVSGFFRQMGMLL